MPITSDRDRLLDELDELDRYISSHLEWTPEYGEKFLRREKVKKDLKALGKKDWFKRIED